MVDSFLKSNSFIILFIGLTALFLSSYSVGFDSRYLSIPGVLTAVIGLYFWRFK